MSEKKVHIQGNSGFIPRPLIRNENREIDKEMISTQEGYDIVEGRKGEVTEVVSVKGNTILNAVNDKGKPFSIKCNGKD